LLASVQGYVATSDATGIQLHLLAAGTVTGAGMSVDVRTGYPWDGDVVVGVTGRGELAVRVPTWAGGATVDVDGGEVLAGPEPGEYLRVACRDGATVRLVLPLTPRFVRADERVDAVRGCVAVVRGPVVFCIEQADLPGGVLVEDVRVDPAVPPAVERPDGDDVAPVRLRLSGVARPAGGMLYVPADDVHGDGEPIEITAIPYQAWANRGPGAMRVWIPVA
jgi:DUF1680 family protein